MYKKDTKQKLLNAFNALQLTSDFNRITVDDIVKKAGVSRATFYRHFHDKYDVMHYNYTLLLNRSLSKHTYTSMEELFVQLLEEGRKQNKELTVLFSASGVNSLTAYISRYSYMVARNLYETGKMSDGLPKKRSITREQDIQLKLFCNGVAIFFEEWVKGKHNLRSEEAARILYQVLPVDFKGNLWE